MLTEYRGVPLAQVADIRPISVRVYVKARRWKRIANKRENVAVFQTPKQGRYEQLIIPVDKEIDDFSERIIDVVLRIAEFEGRTPTSVINDLLAPNSDTIRFAIEGREADAGFVSLLGGIDLLEGAKKALLASACSVLSPIQYHPRLSRSEADLLLSSSHLNHTEQGSFVVSISCPLDAVNLELQPMDMFNEEYKKSFTRQTTLLLMKSIDQIVRAIRSDNIDTLIDYGSDVTDTVNEKNELDQPVISANLCDAILGIMDPLPQDSSLKIAASWAPILPIYSKTPPTSLVRIKKEYFDSIEHVRNRLTPVLHPATDRYFGTVETLNGSMDAANRRYGEVILLTLSEYEVIRVRADLTADQYKVAVEAHISGKVVTIFGTLQRAKRLHRIIDVKSFGIADTSE